MLEPYWLEGDNIAKGMNKDGNENSLRTFTVELEISDNAILETFDIDSAMQDLDNAMSDMTWCCGIRLVKTN